MRTVAALYVDPRGPYPRMPGVDAWDERRDATKYAGPHPIVGHPTCGPHGDLRAFCKGAHADHAALCVEQVRKWGGVLEHPRSSRLWLALDMPWPGDIPDAWGGWVIDVNQVSWGHVAKKRTRLYFVGIDPRDVVPRTGGEPTHCIGGSTKHWRGRKDGPRLKVCSAEQRRRTPLAFAEWLVEIARNAAPRRLVAPGENAG